MAPGRLDRDRIRGALLGLAVGDALGAPLEGRSRAEVAARDDAPLREMAGGRRPGFEPGDVTDDTQLAMTLAESIVEVGGYDPDHALRAYVRWFEAGAEDAGPTTRAVLGAVAGGASSYEATQRQHEEAGDRATTNGALMRTTPIALAFAGNEEGIRDATLADASLTHYDPIAGKAALFHNLLVSVEVSQGHAAVEAFLSEPGQLDERIEDAVVPAASGSRYYAERLAEEQPTWVISTLAVGLGALLTAESFEEGLVWAVNLGGDTDTNGAVAGALLGARFGGSQIPERWIAALAPRERLEHLAGYLATMAGA
jgi:ADP-ribosyl-[dinitrogen reductase] hydrolase